MEGRYKKELLISAVWGVWVSYSSIKIIGEFRKLYSNLKAKDDFQKKQPFSVQGLKIYLEKEAKKEGSSFLTVRGLCVEGVANQFEKQVITGDLNKKTQLLRRVYHSRPVNVIEYKFFQPILNSPTRYINSLNNERVKLLKIAIFKFLSQCRQKTVQMFQLRDVNNKKQDIFVSVGTAEEYGTSLYNSNTTKLEKNVKMGSLPENIILISEIYGLITSQNNIKLTSIATEHNEFGINFGTKFKIVGDFFYNAQTKIIRCFSPKILGSTEDINKYYSSKTLSTIIKIFVLAFIIGFSLGSLENSIKRLKALKKSLSNKTVNHKQMRFLSNYLRLMDINEVFTEKIEDLKCSICKNEDREIIFKPCLHFLVCEFCKELVKNQNENKCPKCKVIIEDVVKIYSA